MIRDVWDRIIPNYPIEFKFLDQELDRMYRTEERMVDILKYFAILAVFISCLGLFGLASYMAEQRTKEIGVRKVLGATVTNIVMLLSTEFARWVLLANLVAWPVAGFPRGVLARFDLPDIYRALGRRLSLVQPWDVMMKPLRGAKLRRALAEAGLPARIVS